LVTEVALDLRSIARTLPNVSLGQKVAARIEQRLNELQMGARQVARHAQIGESTIGQFLRRSRQDPNADISMHTLEAIARATHTSLLWLLTGHGSPEEVFIPGVREVVVSAMELMRTDGIDEDALFDWFTGFRDNGESALELAQAIQRFLPRWKQERARHEPEEATNVTLVDIARRWPTRWHPRAYDLAENDSNPGNTWAQWKRIMQVWDRHARLMDTAEQSIADTDVG